MRLTLRTLLAYLDDILDPEDAQDLKQKINESEFAAKLVERIRNSLGPAGIPNLSSRISELDPNTVAEYLDNTLSPDLVPDFEKACLESNVHLGEVAAAHQILTLVLGEPAAVDLNARKRMYNIGQVPANQPPVQAPPAGQLEDRSVNTPLVNEALVSSSAVATSAALHAAQDSSSREKNGTSNVAKPRPKPEVPDYLRENNRIRLMPLVVTLALAFVVVALLLRALGPFDATHPLAGLMGVPPVKEVADAAEPTDPDLVTAEDGSEPVPVKVVKPPEEDPSPPAEPTPPKNGEDGNPPEPGVEPMPIAPSPPPDQVATVDPPIPPAGVPVVPPIPEPAIPAEPEVPPEPAEPAVEVMNMGRYGSNLQVLARHNPAASQWERMEGNAAVSSGDTLLALPTYRPDIVLAPGVKATLIGPARMRLLPPGTQGAPRADLEYGRAVVLPVAQLDTGIELDLGLRHGLLTFSDADSSAGVEVIRYLPPGSNPEETPAAMFVQIFAVSGGVTWREGVDPPIAIPAGAVAVLRGDEPASLQIVEESPQWLSSQPLTGIDRFASQTMETLLPYDKPLSLALKEAAGDRRAEIKSLAARSLGYLDELDALMPLLSDQFQRSFWPDHFDALQAALHRSPSSAAEVREMLSRLRSEEADQLYRMLWGYSQQQLDEGAAAELVASLDHASMDHRVLAFENLRRITGFTLSYLPDVSEVRRRSTVQRWKGRLDEKLIVYKTPPSPIPERKPVQAAGAANIPAAVAPPATVPPAVAPPASALPAVPPIE